MTKNGELIQIIEIKGYAERFSKMSSENLRDVIRRVLNDLLSEDVMFFLYVKRDYERLENNATYSYEYAQLKHNQWLLYNDLQEILTNVLYVAIIHKGGKSSLSIKKIISNITFRGLAKIFQSELDLGLQKLSEVSMQILQATESYGVKLLTIKSKDNKFISEPLSFLYYITHYSEKDIEISDVDYEQILTSNLNLDNLYNTIVIKNESDNYAAVFSLKSPYKLTTDHTDQILNLDQRMIITETIRLGDNKSLINKLQDLKSWYTLSQMEVGIESVSSDIETLSINKAVFTQVTITVLGNVQEDLSNNLLKTINLLYDMGIGVIREDFYMISSLFSTLPGNSYFLRREMENIINNSAIFSSIKPKSLGGYNGSQWGKPITVFKTIDGLPYFFNFHNKNSVGHTIVVGSKDKGCDLLSEFILLESLKFDLKIIDFYSQEDNELLKMCEGKVIDDFSIDLISVISKDCKEFCKLFHFILGENCSLEGDLYKILEEIYNILLEDSLSNLKISKLSELLESNSNPLDTRIKSNLLKIFSDQCFFKFLDKDYEITYNISNIRIKNYINTLDLPQNISENLITTVLLLFLKKINQETFISSINQFIVRTDANILNTPDGEIDIYRSIFLELAKKGIVIFINCNNKSDLYRFIQSQELIQSCIPTRFFLSEKLLEKEFAKIFHLSQKELNSIKMYHPKECIFLMKQDDEPGICASFKVLKNL